jgi:predicted DNA-binding transcriptional regulator YafY
MATKRGQAKPGARQSKKKKSDVLRNDQIIRVLKVARELSLSSGCDLYELAERHNTDPRTIRRDLEALEDAGFKFLKEQADDSSRVRWRLDPTTENQLTRLLDTNHFLALRLAMAEAQVLRKNSTLFANIEDLSDRIEKALGPRGRQQLRELDACFLSWEKFAWRDAPADVMWTLVDAIANKKVCAVTYRAPSSGNSERRFRVLPLKLLVHNGSLYVHTWQEHFKSVLLLNLQRLKKLEVLEERVTVPEAYDPDRLEHSAFGIFIGKAMEEFELRFDAFARPYIEERSWHPSQDLTPLEDGGALLRFTCTSSYEVTNWVASWQQHVEVISPVSMREQFATYGQWLTRKYAPAG